MWKVYASSGKGIAIRTTFERLKSSFHEGGPTVYGGKVKYIDFDTYDIDLKNFFNWAIIKRESFAHEREFRMIVIDDKLNSAGVGVPVKIERLIECIFIAPTVEDWFFDLINRVVQRYDITCDVRPSELGIYPKY